MRSEINAASLKMTVNSSLSSAHTCQEWWAYFLPKQQLICTYLISHTRCATFCGYCVLDGVLVKYSGYTGGRVGARD